MAFNPSSLKQNPANSTSSTPIPLLPAGRKSLSYYSMPGNFFPCMADSEKTVSEEVKRPQPK